MKKNLFIFTCVAIFTFYFFLFSSSESELSGLAEGLENIRKGLPKKPTIPEEKPMKWKKEWGNKPWYWDTVVKENNLDYLTGDEEGESLILEKDRVKSSEEGPIKKTEIRKLKNLFSRIKELYKSEDDKNTVQSYIDELF